MSKREDSGHSATDAEFKIERGIPIPPRTTVATGSRHGALLRALLSMKIGDSTMVAKSRNDEALPSVQSRAQNAVAAAKKREDRTFSLRRVEDKGYRVWRVK